MQQFKVTIKSSKGEIVLGNLGDVKKDATAIAAAKTVAGVDVKFDTIDENVTDKSHGMLARVTVHGKIMKENHKELKEVMQWAVDKNGETQYRTVIIEMLVAGGEEPYGYEIQQMFVEDYFETYQREGEGAASGSKAEDTFELKLTQRQDFLGEIIPF
ncbi:hypothetical protein [Selenomonas bovis]|uniref:hypothetical protein n=1 Tax=Selenomonas bovis TaxID=416586 RepID=UPI0004E19BB9|nr:hypothetical protein [Selenomonas bovis]MDY6268653.1 hypothetical protein [Selenomonadaceae bacterium]